GSTAGKHNVSKGVIRYLIMGASAIPYSQGAAGTAIGVDRVYEYPRAGLLPFAVAGAGFALWQLKRYRDEGSKSDAARAAGLADLADSIRMDREKHVLYAAASWLGAVLAAALGIEKVPVLELGDSARITLYPDGSYRLRYTLDPAK
ncbi:MAG: hypothetical protein IH899_16600, partial [Planctomycetes bacterium]|nr:hypothetical protein [Planctomycetota bacterium]